MLDDFGEKLMHNNVRKLRKGGLNIAAFSRRMKFVNVYDQLTLTKSFMKCWLSQWLSGEWLTETEWQFYDMSKQWINSCIVYLFWVLNVSLYLLLHSLFQ